MKRKILLVGMLGFTALFGCSQASENAEAGVPEGFVAVQKSTIGGDRITKFKDIDTGCYYIHANETQAVSIVQMFIEKNGVSVPYCEEDK